MQNIYLKKMNRSALVRNKRSAADARFKGNLEKLLQLENSEASGKRPADDAVGDEDDEEAKKKARGEDGDDDEENASAEDLEEEEDGDYNENYFDPGDEYLDPEDDNDEPTY